MFTIPGILKAQSESPLSPESLHTDSCRNLIRMFTRSNEEISRARVSIHTEQGITNLDTLLFRMDAYAQLLMAKSDFFTSLEVPLSMQKLKETYLLWLSDALAFSRGGLRDLLTYAGQRNRMLLSNPDADTKYLDRQISEVYYKAYESNLDSEIAYQSELETCKALFLKQK
ncbi:MAG: hypothetical protein H6605_06330 [Flavobacteriales bacterium]|nr:hypothetical protein [Flavobacteriales bacterium]